MTFRKLLILSALIVLMGVGVVYVLGYEFKPQNNSRTLPTGTLPTAYGVHDWLELTMHLEKTEYNLGEPISIALTMSNISNKTQEIALGAYRDFDFQVYNDTNTTVYQWSNRWWGGAIPQIVIFETLNAGQNLSTSFVWHQTCYNYGGFQGFPVSPGTYYIVGQIGSVLSGKNSTIETTPIQMTLVAP